MMREAGMMERDEGTQRCWLVAVFAPTGELLAEEITR